MKSTAKELDVLLKPNLSSFSLNLDYPGYIGRKDETVNNIGDMVVPGGTKLTWNFETQNTDKIEPDQKQPENKNILVTGGVGYIGSNTVVKVFESGYNPIIIDDLSNSDFSRLNELETITNSEIHYYFQTT